MSKNNEKLEALENLENTHKGIQQFEKNETVVPPKENTEFKDKTLIDGYKVLDSYDLPFGGALYPPSWKFAYKCPTTAQIANFSTLNETDQPAIIGAIEELIKACFIIVDHESQQQISSNQINDGERLFFFLLLREFYLHDKPISWITMSQTWSEQVEVKLVARSLEYKKLNEKLLSLFDGRKFSIPVEGLTENINFLIPTLDISSRIFRYMVKTYRDSQKDDNDNKKDSEAFNKQFLIIAPFLYEIGNESVDQLKAKFKILQKNEERLNAYLTIISKLNLTNSEKITYEYKESQEETQIKFPGGWKNMFINTEAFGGIFD